jgi:hypothetical protein
MDTLKASREISQHMVRQTWKLRVTDTEESLVLPRYHFLSAMVLIAAAAMLLPAMLAAQESTQNLSPPPGTSWGSAPLSKASGSRQTEATLHEATHKAVCKTKPTHRS